MGDDFFRTRMGQKFFESTVPRIADELARLNRNLEALVALLERRGGGVPLAPATETGDPAPSTRAPDQRR
jgi:NADPH-dependent 7-cyano-7-deazaguanine reductase QueF